MPRAAPVGRRRRSPDPPWRTRATDELPTPPAGRRRRVVTARPTIATAAAVPTTPKARQAASFDHHPYRPHSTASTPSSPRFQRPHHSGTRYGSAPVRGRDLDDVGDGEEHGQPGRSPHDEGGEQRRHPGQTQDRDARQARRSGPQHHDGEQPVGGRPSAQPPARPTTAVRAPCSRPTPVRCRRRSPPRRWTARRRRRTSSSRRSCGRAPTVASTVAATAASSRTPRPTTIRTTSGALRFSEMRFSRPLPSCARADRGATAPVRRRTAATGRRAGCRAFQRRSGRRR